MFLYRSWQGGGWLPNVFASDQQKVTGSMKYLELAKAVW